MGNPQPPHQVLLVMAAFSRHAEGLAWAKETAERHLGPVALTSPNFDFNQTDYYTVSMGTNLKKVFYAFETLVDPAELPKVKRMANGWEDEYGRMGTCPEARPLNLDPGYITEAKLVLASTKDHAHRLYLQSGIYGEVTLYYQHRQWRCHPWTFPDYQTADYHSFFERCRNYLRDRRANRPAAPGEGMV